MQPGNPLEDSRLGGIQGKGQVDLKKFKEIVPEYQTTVSRPDSKSKSVLRGPHQRNTPACSS